MEKSKLDTNNELIAKFLGYSQPHPKYPESTYWFKKNRPPLTVLLYKYNWNHLMDAVEKIEELGYTISIDKYTTIYEVEGQNRLDRGTIVGYSKIINTYKAVVKFIEFYNKQ